MESEGFAPIKHRVFQQHRLTADPRQRRV